MQLYHRMFLPVLFGLGLHGAPAHSAGSDVFQAVALREHNAIRSAVGVEPLAWDGNLAKFAQTQAASLAKRCGLKHSTASARTKIPGWQGVYVGENIAYGGNSEWTKNQASSTQTATAEAVKGWGQEKSHYTYAKNTCAPGQVCGHYTQIVWSASKKVGCGFAWCGASMPQYIFVCAYGPGGNNPPSQKPY